MTKIAYLIRLKTHYQCKQPTFYPYREMSKERKAEELLSPNNSTKKKFKALIDDAQRSIYIKKSVKSRFYELLASI